eukprot:6213190-Pleurochrysis_carterae.AAC.2
MLSSDAGASKVYQPDAHTPSPQDLSRKRRRCRRVPPFFSFIPPSPSVTTSVDLCELILPFLTFGLFLTGATANFARGPCTR